MIDTNSTTGAATSTAVGTAQADYAHAKPVDTGDADPVITTRTATERHMVTTFRVHGEVRVRLVPSASPSAERDDTT
jgi:hypothetical protein